MIAEKLNHQWKIALARTGDARVFGERSDVRRKMDEATALAHFTTTWSSSLEPELSQAPIISKEDAKELLEEKSRQYVLDGFEYRQFALHNAVFVARLKDQTCDQLWAVGAHRDNTRLCMFFDTIADRERFEYVAGTVNRSAKDLALELAMDFLNKFPSK